MIQEKLMKAFEMHNGILTTELALKFGINDSTLRKAVERKDVYRHSRGIYLLDEVYEDDLYILQLRYPRGIISHDTAMMLHELTTFSPFVYHLTFPKGYHLSDAKEQLIEMHYANENELKEEYIQTIDSWESNPIKVTNLEKTIIDSFRYEELMTFIMKEMIHNYVQRKDKNIDRLIDYAKRFKVLEIVEREVLPFVK